MSEASNGSRARQPAHAFLRTLLAATVPFCGRSAWCPAGENNSVKACTKISCFTHSRFSWPTPDFKLYCNTITTAPYYTLYNLFIMPYCVHDTVTKLRPFFVTLVRVNWSETRPFFVNIVHVHSPVARPFLVNIVHIHSSVTRPFFVNIVHIHSSVARPFLVNIVHIHSSVARPFLVNIVLIHSSVTRPFFVNIVHIHSSVTRPFFVNIVHIHSSVTRPLIFLQSEWFWPHWGHWYARQERKWNASNINVWTCYKHVSFSWFKR